MIRISVIIVNYNARYFLKTCIESVLRSDSAEHVEIIVVDNNSTDGSTEMLRKDYPEVIILQNSENIGFSKANNRGVSEARGDYVLILNPDTILSETTLSEVLEFSENQSEFGAAGVQFIDGSGKYLPESKRNFPDLKVAGSKLLGYSNYYYANHVNIEASAEIDILTGAFMFIKRKVYHQVGGFDEDFFMYGEDIDLSHRIGKAGFKNYYLGSSKVLHFKGESTLKDKFYLMNFYGALSIFYKKHFPEKTALHGLVDVLIKGIISVKSIFTPLNSKVNLTYNSIGYLGSDTNTYNKLKLLFPSCDTVNIKGIANTTPSVEIIFIDSQYYSYKEIIAIFSNPLFKDIRKRIIDHDSSYYLGSDTSEGRGDVGVL